MKLSIALIFLLLAGVTISGCISQAEPKEIKYQDPNNTQNYIIFQKTFSVEEPDTFSIITTDFSAGGTYTETSEAYSLKFSEAPVGLTLKKSESGIEIGEGIYWTRV